MAGMDPKRRKFLKHLGLLGFGALIALGITHATSPTEAQIIKNHSNAEVKSGNKIVWNSISERETKLYPAQIYSARTSRSAGGSCQSDSLPCLGPCLLCHRSGNTD